jgi:hypothetical protein
MEDRKRYEIESLKLYCRLVWLRYDKKTARKKQIVTLCANRRPVSNPRIQKEVMNCKVSSADSKTVTKWNGSQPEHGKSDVSSIWLAM